MISIERLKRNKVNVERVVGDLKKKHFWYNLNNVNQNRKSDAIYSECDTGCGENNQLGYSLPITLDLVLSYSTFGLTRIFHTDHLRRPGSQMDLALDSHCDLGGMYTYSPASKCWVCLTPSAFAASSSRSV